MAALSSSQCSGSSAGASAARGDCQPYSSNDFESFDSESEISSSREVGGRRRTVAVGNFRVVANADHRRPSRAHPCFIELATFACCTKMSLTAVGLRGASSAVRTVKYIYIARRRFCIAQLH